MAAQDRPGMSVALICQDMPQSVAFYRDQLGFKMQESWPSEDTPMWCNLTLDGQSVMLGAAMDPSKLGELCNNDPDELRIYTAMAERFAAHPAGVGITVYVMVPDIDAYDTELRARGVTPLREPKTQFYGIRETLVDDPDGYRMVFFTPVAMSSCQSCGMPLSDGEPGQMYCEHCTDDKGTLKPFEQVFEGTVQGYFMGMQNMPRPEAEQAAKAHLKQMPAWAGH